MKEKINNLLTAIPYRPIHLTKLILSCPTCGTINTMEATGYALQRNGDDLKAGQVRFVLQSVFGENTKLCKCFTHHLDKNPVVAIFANNKAGLFN